MHIRRLQSADDSRRGNATVIACVTLLVIGGLAGVVASVGHRQSGETHAAVEHNRALFAAQAGANAAIAALAVSTDAADDEELMGTEEAPIEFSGASYWMEVEAAGGELYRILAHGSAGQRERVVEVMLQTASSEGPFQSAVFAGNSSGDQSYTMEFGGTGSQADYVHGNIYSGGSVSFTGDADVTGTVYAANSASGVDAETGVTRPIPDLAAEDYAATADFKVAELFAASETYAANAQLGGSAYQVPATNPAHIFRKNPSDRSSNTSTTVKDDYFLEDPHESNSNSSQFDISLSGVNGAAGTSSNQKVFYIDGNLWIHNYYTLLFKVASGSGGVQVTFVVKGNVYLSDDFVYTSTEQDGVAFIAMKDPSVTDSGNIYFGDPNFGTLDYMHGFMYAENNFYDNNLVSSSGGSVELFGNMTAGNQVLIERDYVRTRRGVTTTYHTQMGIEFDERLADGELTLPGIPRTAAEEGTEMAVLSWREVGNVE